MINIISKDPPDINKIVTIQSQQFLLISSIIDAEKVVSPRHNRMIIENDTSLLISATATCRGLDDGRSHIEK